MPLLSAVRYEYVGMRWLRLVGSIKLQVSFAKEPYKRDDILQKRPVILSILLTVATPHLGTCEHVKKERISPKRYSYIW